MDCQTQALSAYALLRHLYLCRFCWGNAEVSRARRVGGGGIAVISCLSCYPAISCSDTFAAAITFMFPYELLLSCVTMPRLSEFPPLHIAAIHYYYGMFRGNASAARTAYLAAYPNRRPIPSSRNFQEVHRRFENIGLGTGRERREPSHVIDVAIEEAVLRDLFADPSISTRRLALRHGISQKSAWRILRREGLHPYHYQRVQHLHDDVDWRPRCVMSIWLQRKTREDPEFPKTILWMDEAQFTRDGITNCRNLHKWCYKGQNPRLKRSSTFQVRFSVNVWAALIDNLLIGPVILPPRLTGQRFLELLRDELPLLTEDVPIGTYRRMFLQMDGCPAHYEVNVRNFLNESYPSRWIGRAGPVGWPARSPDMTPLDYFLWGTMKQRVYCSPINTEADLHDRIMSCAADLKNDPEMIRRATQQVVLRAGMCLQQRGGHFEHLMH